ncbi:MAG: purine-nucleoside phosphorylase [Clostridiales bacterium]|nr:purine-nucleoside phosphorylase [Clostridiales bacterium]
MAEKNIIEKLNSCVSSVRRVTDFVPRVALTLGSGLGDYAKNMRVAAEIDYKDIDGFPVSTVAGHAGKLIFGHIGDVPLVCMQGRVHYYEGYPMTDVVLPVRLMKMLGATSLVLTNAAGGLGDGMAAGDLMLITGQISSFVPSPLIGPNIDELGPRFPDMSEIYDRELIALAKKCAAELGIDLKDGTYLQFTGPAYETPQEVRMAKILGADAVGMSTACEAVAANHMGMRIVGISCISNLACGLSEKPLSHEEVQAAADEAAPRFAALVTKLIEGMGELCR